MAGLIQRTYKGAPIAKPNEEPDQITDYGNIMRGYGDISKSNEYQPVSFASSTDVNNALGSLRNFSETGGYSPSDISNIRERSISPIRSIYANAQQNLKRRLSLSGGYSPGYAAAVAKMARDSSQQISDVTGNVNATLAQNIVGNRMNATNAYAGLASGEEGRGLDTEKFNRQMSGDYLNRSLSINDARRGLYGTTPALADLFGRQAMESARLNEQSRQFDQSQAQQAALNLLSKRIIGGGYTGRV